MIFLDWGEIPFQVMGEASDDVVSRASNLMLARCLDPTDQLHLCGFLLGASTVYELYNVSPVTDLIRTNRNVNRSKIKRDWVKGNRAIKASLADVLTFVELQPELRLQAIRGGQTQYEEDAQEFGVEAWASLSKYVTEAREVFHEQCEEASVFKDQEREYQEYLTFQMSSWATVGPTISYCALQGALYLIESSIKTGRLNNFASYLATKPLWRLILDVDRFIPEPVFVPSLSIVRRLGVSLPSFVN